MAVCDRDLAKAQAFAEHHGIPTCIKTSMPCWLRDDIHAVSNVTPDGVHKATSLAAIAAGKHILCEKPLATNAQGAHEWRPLLRPLT